MWHVFGEHHGPAFLVLRFPGVERYGLLEQIHLLPAQGFGSLLFIPEQLASAEAEVVCNRHERLEPQRAGRIHQPAILGLLDKSAALISLLRNDVLAKLRDAHDFLRFGVEGDHSKSHRPNS